MEAKDLKEGMRVLVKGYTDELHINSNHVYVNTLATVMETPKDTDESVSLILDYVNSVYMVNAIIHISKIQLPYTSNTKEEFFKVIEEVNKLREKEKLLIEKFEKSTDELSECFHWMIKCALDGSNHCCLTPHSCPELYAKELKGMGFLVREGRNVYDTVCSEDVWW